MSVMIGTKVKNAEIWLPRFLHQLEKLEDPVNRVVFLYGESTDSTFRILSHWRCTTTHKVQVYHEPYLPPGERHGYMLARLKQDLQRIFKEGDEDYFMSFDCDVVQFPSNIIGKLMADSVDVVAPMVWTENRAVPTFFDSYVFRKEGCRFHPYDPPGLGSNELVPVDSVGNSCALYSREAELKGVYRNPNPNIPFCKSLKDQGFQIWVDPRINVYHIDLEYYGILHYPPNISLSNSPYITSTNDKISPEQMPAIRHHLDRTEYDKWFRRKYPDDAKAILESWNNRPLITASYKVFNEGKFLKYSLESVYPYVDCIDIIEGCMTSTAHLAGKDGSSTDNTLEIIKTFPDPQHKIRLTRRPKWHNREEMQTKLLEICKSKWMLFIDGDEIIDPKSMKKLRSFCQKNQNGEIVYARPERFYNFWHDFWHIAYSLNPLSPWAQYGLPHAFLIWTDIPGLNFAKYHTIPHDGFGVPVSLDSSWYRKRQAVVDGVFVYHFGNAKGEKAMRLKFATGHPRSLGRDERKLEDDPWYSGTMSEDMVLEEFDAKHMPKLLRTHADYAVRRIKITESKINGLQPVYKFKVYN